MSPKPAARTEHVSPRRAERETNAELAAALGHRGRHRSEDTEASQQDGGQREARDGRRVEARPRQRSANHVVHPLNRGAGNIGFDRAQHGLDRWSHGGGVGGRADDEVAGLVPDPRLLRVRGVDARSRRQSQRQLAHVADDADDFNLQRPAAIERQALADWVSPNRSTRAPGRH